MRYPVSIAGTEPCTPRDSWSPAHLPQPPRLAPYLERPISPANRCRPSYGFPTPQEVHTSRTTSPESAAWQQSSSLPDGSTTDISAQTARLFISSTPDGFIDFLRATKRDALLGWRLARYAAHYPRFFRTLRANASATRVPVSYATVGYHALHAYRWVDAHGGERFVRYHWVPQAGEQFLSPRAARSKSADFLTEEMKTRLADGPVRFDLQVQVAGAKDSTTDPSAPWASTNTITVGTLQITEPDSDRESSGHIVVFDPMRVTDGIEPSDDPVLHFRSYAYSVSVKDRTGVSRGPEAP